MTRSEQIAARAAAIAANTAAHKLRVARGNLIDANAQLDTSADLMTRGTPDPADTAAWGPAIADAQGIAGRLIP